MRTNVNFLGLLAVAVALPAVLAAPTTSTPPVFVPGTFTSASYGTGSIAPLHKQDTHPHIEGSYMVILKNGISATQFLAHRSLIMAAQQSASAFHGESAVGADGIGHIYDLENHMQGYAGKFTDDVVDYIRALPEVEYVELDSVVKTQDMPSMDSMVFEEPSAFHDQLAPTPKPGHGHEHEQLTQKGAPWVSGADWAGSYLLHHLLITFHPLVSRVSLVSLTGKNCDWEPSPSTSTTPTPEMA